MKPFLHDCIHTFLQPRLPDQVVHDVVDSSVCRCGFCELFARDWVGRRTGTMRVCGLMWRFWANLPVFVVIGPRDEAGAGASYWSRAPAAGLWTMPDCLPFSPTGRRARRWTMPETRCAVGDRQKGAFHRPGQARGACWSYWTRLSEVEKAAEALGQGSTPTIADARFLPSR